MKRICAVCMLFYFTGFGQHSVKPILLKVTSGKTTTLIFPFAIRQVDRGISILLAQKSAGLENVLLIKAARPNFPETNLTVFTSDGKLYPFLVQYSADPDILNYSFADSVDIPEFSEARLKTDSETAGLQSPFLHHSVRDFRMVFRLDGIYKKEHVLWFCLKIINHSVIDYTPAGWHCFVRNKKQVKRTAVQEIEKLPVYQSVLYPVTGHESVEFILGFPVFTISKSQELVIQCTDSDGERVLVLPVGSRKLQRARPFKNYQNE